jgi:hypothetical protein
MRRILSLLFGCSRHGIVAVGSLDVLSRCTLRAWHRGEHVFSATPDTPESGR